MRIRTISAVAGLAAALSAFGYAGAAQAATCESLPNPVYIAGATAAEPIVAEVAKILGSRDEPITLVYQPSGSCAGAGAVLSGDASTGTAEYWDPENDFELTACDIPTAGVAADIGISDVYAESCGLEVSTGYGDFYGSIQVMAMVTPAGSTEDSISAEAAYLIFGFGGDQHPVAPWTSEEQLYIRADSSGTKQMIAKAINLPAPKWKGAVQSGSRGVNEGVTSSTQPNATIGILSADHADGQRDKMKILAYQHYGQSCAYYPDSTANAYDKINVREGRYAIWGAVHFFTHVDDSGKPIPAAGNPAGDYVAETIQLLTHDNLSEEDNEAIVRAEIAAFTVPQCAMKVTRHSEIGDPVPYDPATPCGCFFESMTGTPSDYCTECNTDSDCGGDTPSCRFGYCEAR